MRFTTIFALLILSFSCFAEEQKPYTVFLKAGTVLTSRLDHKTEVVLSKGIYAKVLETDPKRRDLFLVYNKYGLAEYEVKAEGVTEIADDIRILPKEDAEKIYPVKSVFKAENKTATFDSQLNIHFDNLQLSNLNNIYNDEITNVISTRYEARTLYISQLPVNFGFTLNFQSAYWKNDVEEVRISILSLGPVLQYNFYKSDNVVVNGLMGAEVAPIYRGSTASYTDKYSAMLFDLGVESEWQSPLGILTLGSHFRHHELALSETTRPNLQLTPKEFSLNSLGIMIGYKIEWDL